MGRVRTLPPPVPGPVARQARRDAGACESFLPRFGGKLWVQPGHRIAEPPDQHQFAAVASLGRRHVRGDVGPVGHLPADPLEPGECGFFDDRC